MLRPRISIVFTQVPTEKYPERKDTFTLNFVHECKIHSSWKNLSDTCKLIFPKKIYIQDEFGGLYDLSGQSQVGDNGLPQRNMYAGTASNFASPFFLRGDKVKVSAGYWSSPNPNDDMKVIFEGFVARINPKMPLEIECEDNMYLLKQAKVKNQVFTGTVESMVQSLITTYAPQLSYKAAPGVSTNIGNFRTMNETFCQILERLRKDYFIESFFRGDKLFASPFAYYSAFTPAATPVFKLTSQDANIIDNGDKLVFTRSDDVRISLKCFSFEKQKITGITNLGVQKTQKKRLEAVVGEPDGEIRTAYFWNVGTVENLIKMGKARLPRYQYEGFRGSFPTFGDWNPETGGALVNHGDIVQIIDRYLPERNGLYFVKSVERIFNMSGYKQEVELDLRADTTFTNPDGTTSNILDDYYANGCY